jgi:exopolysaccharide biosynthesis WecB/TagA/CpsF family protein
MNPQIIQNFNLYSNKWMNFLVDANLENRVEAHTDTLNCDFNMDRTGEPILGPGPSWSIAGSGDYVPRHFKCFGLTLANPVNAAVDAATPTSIILNDGFVPPPGLAIEPISRGAIAARRSDDDMFIIQRAKNAVRTGLGNITVECSQATLPTIPLLGLRLVNLSRDEAMDWLCERIAMAQPTRIAFLNAHYANVAAADPQYRAALASSDALLPDGSGVALAARMHGTPLAANLNGTDLVPALCGRLAAMGRSVFLLGGQPGVAEAAAAKLMALYPGMRIAGTRHGYFTTGEEAELVADVNASGADVLIAALGAPKQDVFLARHAESLDASLTIGVGALFDFLAGRVSRAPEMLRRAGLEWTWRLAQEPGRLARRYIMGNPAFLARAAIAATAPARERLDLAAKRAIDVAGAAAGLIALSPVLLAAMAAIRLTTEGPALLRQTRVGQDGREFGVWKLRSMYTDADARRAALLRDNQHGAEGVTFKMRNDPRVTPVGKWLRRSSVDELPQLWNVLVGDMSLVGPRPPLPQEVARYTPGQRMRLAAKPGLTCLWQISGRSNLAFDRQVELDIQYITTRTVMTDISILLRTIPAVLTARGAY